MPNNLKIDSMDEQTSKSKRSPSIWVYLAAAVVGSLFGAIMDATLYPDGGSMLMKVGFVAGPLALYLAMRKRSGKPRE